MFFGVAIAKTRLVYQKRVNEERELTSSSSNRFFCSIAVFFQSRPRLPRHLLARATFTIAKPSELIYFDVLITRDEPRKRPSKREPCFVVLFFKNIL